MKKIKKLIIILLIVFVAYSYIKVEYLTYKHGLEFGDSKIYSRWFQDAEMTKVFEYSENFAKVYYVSKGKTMGIEFLLLKDENQNWKIGRELKAWSKAGNINSFIWPFYW